MFFKIIEEYTETPGARYIDDGPYSGELFRDYYLIPRFEQCIKNNEKLIIDFDGGYGYSSGFLEESFGGMIRKGFTVDDIINNMEFISEEDPSVIDDIKEYILRNERWKNNDKHKRKCRIEHKKS